VRIVVLQHAACEPAGSYLPLLEKYGEVDTAILGQDAVGSLDAYHGIVVMGGPMGVYDIDHHPWLADEIAAVRAAINADRAVWGVCLGAQVLAAAADARVYPGPVPEVGVGPVQLTAAAGDDPVFGSLPATLDVLHWHQDTFDLPTGAALLGSSAAYPNQAFRLGRSYGVQFHIEAPWSLAEEWLSLPAYEASLEQALGPDGRVQVRDALRSTEVAMAGIAEQLMTNWLELL
jgi:GMP synthase (glutamine-hydrolysing)